MLRSVLRRLVFAAIVAAASGCSAGAGRQLITTGISSYDRQIILDAHNHLRQSVALGRVPGQPGAANMMQMVWDDELAAKAQEWANSCAHGHDPHRHVGRFRVGQNIARSWTFPRPDSTGSTAEFSKQIQNWFNENSGYRYHGHSDAGTGHYSQLIWGDSYLVGCGYSYFQDPVQGYTKLYVCNYGPGGNIRGYTPYQSGSPSCEAFGSHPSSEYSGLCYPPGHHGSSSFGSTSYGSNLGSSSLSNYGSHSYDSSNLGSTSYGSQSFSNSHLGSSLYGSHSYDSSHLGSTGFSTPSYDSSHLGSSPFSSTGFSNSGFSSSGFGSSFGSNPLSTNSLGSSGFDSHSYDSNSFGSSGFGSHSFDSSFGSTGFGSSPFGGFSNLFGTSSRGFYKK